MNSDQINVVEDHAILTPKKLKKTHPLSNKTHDQIVRSRQVISDILSGKDSRIFAVVGPCSIHDPEQALEYASKLLELAKKVEDKIFIVMRVYFEKPRTTVGWKGLINDPHLDDTFEIEEGLGIARKLMVQINDMGLPIGTEALDPISPQFLSDLVSWSAIGARTTESQTHRELASGLSSPVGFKNGTDGSITIATNAMLSAQSGHAFLGINESGQVCVVNTSGNKDAHLILRGGGGASNYDSVSVQEVEEALTKAKLPHSIVVDCSHGNSHKNHLLQVSVLHDIVMQKNNGNQSIKGIMIESNLEDGQQKLVMGKKELLKRGVSITDACLGWEQTEQSLLQAYEQLQLAK